MTGGFEAPTLLWGPVVPMVATLLAGRRAGLIWTLVFIAEAVVLFALERAYGRWPSQLDANATQITMLMSMIGVLTLAFSLCYCYEAIQRRITDELAAEQQTMKQLLSAQEIERQLLAYDIHDGIVQMMTGAAMHVDAGLARLESAEPGATAEMEIARQLLANSIREARRLVSGLRPPILDECGLVAGIEYLIAEHPGLKVRFEHDADMTRLSPLIETALFRICQESLTNAAKYSAANLVEIHLMRRAGKLSLVVRDDGKGFSANTPEDDLRFGLQGIRQRARFLGGQADIKSQQGTGTTISVQVPIGAE
jgi:signal transduction histidine kinase